ncbi:MAG: glycosyltransferase family 4 protein [Bacteroidota bacterium]|nr:glycosyltransferase family 4 protein [Bacteroidota bacterium]
MKMILIGNYLPDRQESMIRFAEMLRRGFETEGLHVTIWWPTAFFGKGLKSTDSGIGKWLGYLDKYIIFPAVLQYGLLKIALVNSSVRFHICDHSNAPYLKYLPAQKTSITCHDVIAIRGSLGYPDCYQPASFLGKKLQQWIFKNLSKACSMAVVSKLTLMQLRELIPHEEAVHKEWHVIHNAFNAEFKKIERSQTIKLVSRVGIDPNVPFILHVGSGLPRKNRKLLLKMAIALGVKWSGNICYAGEALEEDLLQYAEAHGLRNRIISVEKPPHEVLVGLYNGCEAFIFPSLSEGFGWPVIEAQACGAPVIASNVEPMPEVSGNAALHADPFNPTEFASAFLSLQNDDYRSSLIEKGLENSKKFNLANMTNAYLQLHRIKSYNNAN